MEAEVEIFDFDGSLTRTSKGDAVLEREVKLAVGETFVIPELDGAVPGASVGPVEERPIHDVYYDTADFRLARWGCTLRFRDDEGWTAKIPVPGTGRILRRSEVTFDAQPDKPPPRVLALVRSLTRGEPLAEVARFTTSRFARTWRTPDGQDVVELTDDRVRVQRPSGERRDWRELEVELAPEADEPALIGIVERLEAAGAADGGTTPKLMQAVGDPALGPPDVVEPAIPKKPTARQVIQAAIARSVTHLVLHLPAARIGRDIEGVHQARVATRRLRSDLRTYRPLLEPAWATELERDLKWLADELGKVRDEDVLLSLLRATIERNPELAGPGADGVIKALERQRRCDNRTLLDHLNRQRADQLLGRLVEAAADPMTTTKADDPASDRLPHLVRKRWRRLQRAVDALDPEPPIEDLHRVRILAKRARYAAEAVIPAFGPQAKAFAKAIAGIQDVLGELNDAEVAEQWLTELAETADGTTAFAAGRLAQIIRTNGEQYRQGWQKHYRKAGRRKLQAWLA